MLTGGCFCGAVRYEAGSPYHLTNCHCTTCRRTSGAAFVTWFSVRRGEFRLTQGAPVRFRSSSNGVRSFCARCGGHLTFEFEDADEVDVTTCTLDDPGSLPPEDHTWTRSKLAWVHLADGLPEYREVRGA
jgi:hypothetical protein